MTRKSIQLIFHGCFNIPCQLAIGFKLIAVILFLLATLDTAAQSFRTPIFTDNDNLALTLPGDLLFSPLNSEGTVQAPENPAEPANFICNEKPLGLFTWTGSTSNDYNVGSNWDQGTVPTATDDIIIAVSFPNPCSVNSGSFIVNSLTISGTGDLRMLAGTSLTISNNVTYTSSIAPTLDCSSTIVFNKSALMVIPPWNYGSLTNINGAVRAWSGTGITGICNVFTPGFVSSYTATVGSTVDYTGTGAQIIQSVYYYNLSNSGNGPRSYTVGFANIIDIASQFTPTTGTVTPGTFNTINFSSSSSQTIPTTRYNGLSNTGNGPRILAPVGANSNKITVGSFTLGSGSYTVINSTVEFVGIGTYSMSPFTYYNVIFNAAGTCDFNQVGGTINVLNDLTITSSVNLSRFNIGSVSGAARTLNVTGNIYIQNGGILQLITDANSTGGTVNIGGNLNITGTGKINLEPVSSATGTGIVNLTGNFNCSGTSAGGIVDFGAGASLTGNGIFIKGNFSHTGTGSFITSSLAMQTSGFVFNGAAPQTLTYSGGASQRVSYQVAAGANVQLLTPLTIPAGSPVSTLTIAGAIDCGTQVVTAGDAVNSQAIIINNGILKTAHNAGVTGTLSGFGAAKITGNNGIYQFNGGTQNTGFPASITAANSMEWLGTVSLTLNQNFSINASAGHFNFTNDGLIYLSNFNLTLASTANINGGPFSATKMFVTMGSGYLVKNFTSPSAVNFTWPIGEVTGTADYSPVNFPSFTNSASGDVGFRVIDAVEPNNSPAITYISRYWNSYTTYSSYSWNGNFIYTASDIVGLESDLKLNIYDPNLPFSGWMEYPSSSASSNVLTVAAGPATGSLNNTDITARANLLLYYRSAIASGDWTLPSNWQVSTDPLFILPAPTTATVAPNSINSAGILIRNTHTINITTQVTADDINIAAGGTLNVNPGSGDLTVANGIAATDIQVDGIFSINSGAVATISTGAALVASGYVKHQGTFSSSGSLTFNNLSTFEYAVDGGVLPAATWNTGSTCFITGFVNTTFAGLDQNFYHFIWRCNNQSVPAELESAIISIGGDMTVNSTGSLSQELRLGSTVIFNLPVGGNINVNGGVLVMVGTNTAGGFATANSTVNVAGSVNIAGAGRLMITNAWANATGANNPHLNITGDLNLMATSGVNLVIAGADPSFAGSFSPSRITVGGNYLQNSASTVQMSRGNGTGIGTLAVAGNFTHSAGTITKLAAASGEIIFNGNSPQVYTSGGTVSGIINFTVNTNAILDMNTSFISGGGSFTMQNNSALRMGSPDGIVTGSSTLGNLRSTGLRTLPTQAVYIYNGLTSQNTGSNLPAIIAGSGAALIIDNTGVLPANIVSLSTNNTSTIRLDLNNGRFNAGTGGTLKISAGGVVSGGGGNQLLSGTPNDNIIEYLSNGAVAGTPELYNVTIGNSAGGVDFTNNARINNILLINNGGFVNPNSPKYAVGSTLIYNTASSYTRNSEWGNITPLAPGYPHHVTIRSNTALDFAGTGFDVACGGNLNIGDPAFNSSSGSLDISAMGISDLYVGGNLNIGGASAGSLTMSNTIGGDIYLSGDWSRNALGSVNFGAGNGRAIFFEGGTNAVITADNGQIFPYVYINKSTPATKVTLADHVNITDEISFKKGTVDLGANNKFLTLLSTAAKTARVGISDPLNTNFVYGTDDKFGQFIIQRYVPARRSWRLMAAPISGIGTHTVSEAWQERGNPLTGLDYTATNYVASIVADSISNGFATHITGGLTSDGFDRSPTNNPGIKLYSSGTWAGPANINNTSVKSQEGWMLFLRGDRKTFGEITNQYKPATITTLRPRGRIFLGSKVLTSSGITVVGNPYASAVDYFSMSRTGSGWPGFPTYYVWDPYLGGATGQGAFVTLTWNGTDFSRSSPYGTGTYDNRYIPSGAAVMVDFPPGGTIQIDETDKSIANATSAFRPGEKRQLMTVLNTVTADEGVYVSDGVLSLFDRRFNNAVDADDAKKMTNFAENFSLQRNDKILSVERRKIVSDGDTIFYNMQKMQAKKYQLQFNVHNLGAPSSLTAFLEDLYLKTKTPVSLHDTTLIDFKITSDSDALAGRFRLVFRNAVRCVGLKAFVLNSDIAVNWKVADEFNIKEYVIERSVDGRFFTAAGMISSGGNSDIPVNYQWVDIAPLPGEYFYRIKGVSKNGVLAYSSIVKATIKKSSNSFYVFPNPVSGNIIHLQMNDKTAGQYIVRLMIGNKQYLAPSIIHHPGGTASYHINAGKKLPEGIYQLEVTGPDKKNVFLAVVVNRE